MAQHFSTKDSFRQIPSALLARYFEERSLLLDYRSDGEELWKRVSGGKQGTLWYCRAKAFAVAEKNELGEELDRVVSEIEKLSAGV